MHKIHTNGFPTKKKVVDAEKSHWGLKTPPRPPPTTTTGSLFSHRAKIILETRAEFPS